MSREKQIEIIGLKKTLCVKPCDICSHYGKKSQCIPEYTANRLYEAGYRKQSEWISVDERLPDRNGRYLTHCNIEGQSLVCILHYSKVGGFNEGTVTHWMPLPEAPKMKGGAE